MGIRTVPPPTQTDFDIFDKPPPNIRLTIPAAPALAEPLPLVEPLALTPHCPYLADAHAYARIVRLANANKIPYIVRERDLNTQDELHFALRNPIRQ